MTRKGVWDLQEVRDKYLQSLWTNDASGWSWGSGSYGQLGTGTVPSQSSPAQITGNWTSIAGYRFGGGGVKDDGTLWTWGDNENGENGINNRTAKYDPTQVGTDSTWSVVSSSNGKASYFTKTDGTLWVCGENQNGRLGLNDDILRSSPTQMGTDTNWTYAAGAMAGAHGIKTDGTLWAWGLGTDGRIGDGSQEMYSSPRQIPGTSWAQTTESEDHTMAVRTDGTLWVWGKNERGQIGQNNRTEYSSPRQVPGTWAYSDYNFGACQNEQVSGAIKADGTLWMWGYNHTGALGQNQPMPAGSRSSPVQVGTGSDWKSIRMGSGDPTVIAVKTDGTIWSWGNAGNGALGTNQHTTSRSSPCQIGSESTWDAAAHMTGSGTCYAIQKPLTPSQL